MIKRKPVTPEAALKRMADLCARSEQCEMDVCEKILKLGLSPAHAREIIDTLTENRFIDPARYARAFANDRVRFRGWGRNKIRVHLRSKHIPQEDIDEALEQIDPGEYAGAMSRAADAKRKSLDLQDYADRQKLFRHLVSRGFEVEKVIPLIKSMVRE